MDHSTSTTALAAYRSLEAGLVALIPEFRFSAAINLRLERITRLMTLLDDPHTAFRSLHVGGTSGKGSTSSMLASILHAGGYRTGLHVSPHLQIINERYQIDGRVAPSTDLARLLTAMQPAIEQVGREMPHFGRPSYFEVQFALACLWFADRGVDVAVIEVGLGGTRDATNVIPAEVAVLTNVGLDHMQILGDTIEEIISDKAGIIKPGQTVVTGVTQPSAHAIVADRCAEHGAALLSIGRDFSATTAADATLTLQIGARRLDAVTLGLSGPFQQMNAACATAAALAFDPSLEDDAIRRGLAATRFPGRMETVQATPRVVLDGAHNPDKMRHAAAALQASDGDGGIILVAAVKLGKDVVEILRPALPLVSHLIATEFHITGLWKSVPVAKLAAQARAGADALARDLPIDVEPDPMQAIDRALALAGPADTVWITGSLYLIGNVRERWYPSETLIAQAERGLPASLVPAEEAAATADGRD